MSYVIHGESAFQYAKVVKTFHASSEGFAQVFIIVVRQESPLSSLTCCGCYQEMRIRAEEHT